MAPTFSLGYTLAGRYRILELLGVGQTAEVYVAEDLSLHRRVVVKVLLAALAAHEEIRRAFRDHIVRASKLSQPHLARVFDGGQESGAIFMISEYLSGGSLEDVLGAGRRFSVDDGARLGRDVASALAYIHEQGFVLGSLSPSKMLFDGEGQVRVSDVALAGLAAGYRERMTLDEARYLSPEQAIGEPASSESDVYALALILFEAVTGTAAYEGTTPEAILRARLDSPLPVRLELGSLDMVLAQAAVPDPRLRLDAEQFSARLGAVVHDAAPLVVRPGSQELPLLAQFTAQEERSSIGFRPPSAEQIVGASPEPTGGYTRVPRAAANLGAGGGGVPRGPVGRTPRFERGQYDLPRDPRRWGVIIAVLVLLVVVIGAGAAWKSGLLSKSHSVPNLVGKSVKQASAAIKSGRFTLRVTNRVGSAQGPVGNIVTQTPVVGTSEKSGSTITVSVSKGPVLVTMPTNLVGKSCAAATAQLSALHVTATCPATAAIFSPTVPLNDVARVLYQKGQNPLVVPLRAGVTLSLSKGPAPSTTTTTTSTTTTTLAGQGLRAVPNVVGDNQVQLVEAMKKAGLYYTTTGPHANTTKWTKVFSENPAAGTMVPYKSSVTLTVQ